MPRTNQGGTDGGDEKEEDEDNEDNEEEDKDEENEDEEEEGCAAQPGARLQNTLHQALTTSYRNCQGMDGLQILLIYSEQNCLENRGLLGFSVTSNPKNPRSA